MAKSRRKVVRVQRTGAKRHILDAMKDQEFDRRVAARRAEAPAPEAPSLVAEKPRRPLQAVDREDALGVLKRRQRTWANADRGRDEAVRLARSGGASWEAIGRATGLSADGARSRWGRGR